MINYWILVVKDHHYSGQVIPAMEVLRTRIERKFWSLNSRARNIKRIKPGDRVVFYVSSYEGKGFAGTGVIASPPHPITPEQRFYIFGYPSEKFDYSIDLENPVMWDNLVSPAELFGKVSFLHSERWWARFRGSIIKITEEDYDKIVALAPVP